MSTIIYNGKFISSSSVCIKHNDRGFTLGHGLFETILVKKRSMPLLDYHWSRLEASAGLVNIPIPFSIEIFKSMIEQLIEKNHLQNKMASVRLTITHGEAERGIFPLQTLRPNFTISIAEYSHAINYEFSAVIVNQKKNEHAVSSRVKSTSYLDNILAKKEAIDKGYHEAILLNTVSNVADGSIFNIFIVKNGFICTPKISDGALPGVIRNVLLTECSSHFMFKEQSISVSDLLNADEVFFTNALFGLQPVKKINETIYNSLVITEQIRSLLIKKKNYI